MISLVRVDDRLIHGQVTVGWAPYLRASRIIVVSDRLAADRVLASILRVGVPVGMQIDVVSVDEVNSFKPDPAVYHHFLSRAGAAAENTWLVSGNPFDIIGAHSCGMNTAWVQRSRVAVFDPWGIQPTITVNSLTGLVDAVTSK